MIKQQQRVIKKGDYYEIQSYEQTMMLISKAKKQQSQPQTSTNIPLNELILTQIPSFQSARQNYFQAQLPNQYSNLPLEDLVKELELLHKTQNHLRDQERNQIETLIQQIASFTKTNHFELNSLPAPSDIKQANSIENAKQTPSHRHTPITLTAQYNISALSQRISQLQSLDFPELIALEHQLQIMLGQKKPLQSLELTHMDQKQKQELNHLYNHLNSLSLINNTQRVIDSVFSNENKHVEMQAWLDKMEHIQGLNSDFLTELKQDQKIIKKLQHHFEQNVQQVKQILTELKNNQ